MQIHCNELAHLCNSTLIAIGSTLDVSEYPEDLNSDTFYDSVVFMSLAEMERVPDKVGAQVKKMMPLAGPFGYQPAGDRPVQVSDTKPITSLGHAESHRISYAIQKLCGFMDLDLLETNKAEYLRLLRKVPKYAAYTFVPKDTGIRYNQIKVVGFGGTGVYIQYSATADRELLTIPEGEMFSPAGTKANWFRTGYPVVGSLTYEDGPFAGIAKQPVSWFHPIQIGDFEAQALEVPNTVKSLVVLTPPSYNEFAGFGFYNEPQTYSVVFSVGATGSGAEVEMDNVSPTTMAECVTTPFRLGIPARNLIKV